MRGRWGKGQPGTVGEEDGKRFPIEALGSFSGEAP